jgi:N,N-dimethylformamidase
MKILFGRRTHDNGIEMDRLENCAPGFPNAPDGDASFILPYRSSQASGSWMEHWRRARLGAIIFFFFGCILIACEDAQPSGFPGDAVPPHRAIVPGGIHGYTDRLSYAAGDTVRILVSNTLPYDLSVYRLGPSSYPTPRGEVQHQLLNVPPNPQPIHPGSYVHIDRGLENMGNLQSLSIECWVRPWRTDGWAGIVTEYDYPQKCSYALLLTPRGSVAFYLGNGGRWKRELLGEADSVFLEVGQWYHIVGTWDGNRKKIWVNGVPVGEWEFLGPLTESGEPLRLASYGQEGVAYGFADADLAMPAIYRSALTEPEIRSRFQNGALDLPGESKILACWSFEEEQGEEISDVSGNGHNGIVINHGTWMIGGPSFDAEVPRFGQAYLPEQDALRGHGLRFSSDDLYDCRWTTTHEYVIPEDAMQGIYAGRFVYVSNGIPEDYYVTFVVRRKLVQPKAPIAVLCATNTWYAYNSFPFGRSALVGAQDSAYVPSLLPEFSLYRRHFGGQGTFYLGLRMPLPAANPYGTYGPSSEYGHLVKAERFLHAWLEKSGYDFDLITDLDLHRESGILDGYQCLIINGHSEYWSVPAYETVRRFLDNDGDVICLSGNTLYWRVSLSEDGTVMECRKVDAPGYHIPSSRRGEGWHSQDGERGGLMRDAGYPAWKLLGLETLGWHNAHPEQFGSYQVANPEHVLFTRPRRVELGRDGLLGGADSVSTNPHGHEVDARLTTIRSIQTEPVPPGTTYPSPEAQDGIELLAEGRFRRPDLGITLTDYFGRRVEFSDEVGGEMIWWERPAGGRVFNAGTIGFGWALSTNVDLQHLFQNVLFHLDIHPGNLQIQE